MAAEEGLWPTGLYYVVYVAERAPGTARGPELLLDFLVGPALYAIVRNEEVNIFCLEERQVPLESDRGGRDGQDLHRGQAELGHLGCVRPIPGNKGLEVATVATGPLYERFVVEPGLRFAQSAQEITLPFLLVGLSLDACLPISRQGSLAVHEQLFVTFGITGVSHGPGI